MTQALMWLMVFAALILVEIVTMGLTTIWFAGGALIAAAIAALHAPIWAQIIVFVIVSCVLLYFTRPIAVKYFNKSRVRTNVESMVGKQAIVISEIDNIQGIGQINVGGMEWSARTANGEPLKPGCVVVIKKIEGVKAIVEEQKED